MRIPPDAIIADEKLTRYLLVPRARSDKSRFLERGGFALGRPIELDRAIRQVIESADAVEDTVDEYGTSYTVTGLLQGPNGVRLPVVLVWVRRQKDEQFRFVTLKPHKENRP